MDLFHWISYPNEYRYLTVVFGCKHNPSLEVLNLLRIYVLTHRRYPNVSEFLEYALLECVCDEDCEFYLPYHDTLDVSRYSLIEYGFLPKCRLAHFMYSFRIFEHRFPNPNEIYNYLQEFQTDDTLSRIAADLMERETREYWEKKHSGLTEQDIYKYVQSNEQKESMCCICQETITEGDLIVKLDCSHTFHRGTQYKLSPEESSNKSQPSDCQGIEEWLKSSGTCPICRKQVEPTEASHHHHP